MVKINVEFWVFSKITFPPRILFFSQIACVTISDRFLNTCQVSSPLAYGNLLINLCYIRFLVYIEYYKHCHNYTAKNSTTCYNTVGSTVLVTWRLSCVNSTVEPTLFAIVPTALFSNDEPTIAVRGCWNRRKHQW